MSLIHWWPLNGDTKDYGIKQVNGTLINGTSYDSGGKIGKCLLADSGSLYTGHGVDVPTNLLSELTGKEYTFAAWVKPMGNHVHYEGAIISSGNWNNQCWAFGLNSTNTAINPAGNWYDTAYVSYNFTAGQWYHIVSINKNGTDYVYVNGSLVGTASNHDGVNQSDANNLCIGRETYAGGYFGFNGYINDVRVYDHALSQKEVKEISKGLVLHYNFEDPYIEGTTNLSSANWNSYSDYWTLSSQSNNEIVLVSRGTSHGTVALNNSTVLSRIPTGTTITISGYLYVSDAPYKCTQTSITPYDGWATTSYTSREDGFFSFTGTYANKNDVWIIHIPLFDFQASGTVCKIKNLQFEQKDHATPYVNGTRPAGIVYDNSGYGYNGEQIDCSIVEISNNTNGEFSLRTNTSGYVQIPSIYLDTTFTISTWCKHLDSFSAWARIFDFGNATSGQNYDIGFATSDTSGSTYVFGRVAAGSLPDTWVYSMDFDWHLWSLVVNGTNIKLYKDGAIIREFTAYGNVGGILYTLNYLNKSNWTGDGVSNKYYSDFKIFNTALSAEDIMLEYTRKASLDKNGNLFAPYFKENTSLSNIKLNKNGIVNVSNFAENITLEDGSIWTPIVVHNVNGGVFTSGSPTYVFENTERWNSFGTIGSIERPESGWYEFLVMHQNEVNGQFKWFRFKQNVNPLSASWSQVNPSNVGGNVVRIATNSTWGVGAGMYYLGSSNCPMCFANNTNGNWFGCGIRANWEGGIPSYSEQAAKGFQLVYMRTTSNTKMKQFKNALLKVNSIIEN